MIWFSFLSIDTSSKWCRRMWERGRSWFDKFPSFLEDFSFSSMEFLLFAQLMDFS